MGIMSSRDPKTENSDSRFPSDKEFGERLEAFIKGGDCKESYAAFCDCVDEAELKKEGMDECLPRLLSCMEAHSDYYQPLLAARKAAAEAVNNELRDLVMNKLGGSYERILRYMEGGDCKESARVWDDCRQKESTDKCTEGIKMLWKCMEAHPDYYHPFVKLQKFGDEQLMKEQVAVLFKDRI